LKQDAYILDSVFSWTKRYSVSEPEGKANDAHAEEMRKLNAELKRVTEERDILRKAAAYFAKTSG